MRELERIIDALETIRQKYEGNGVPQAISMALDDARRLNGMQLQSASGVKHFQDRIASKLEEFGATSKRTAISAAAGNQERSAAFSLGEMGAYDRAALWVREADIVADDFGLSDD